MTETDALPLHGLAITLISLIAACIIIPLVLKARKNPLDKFFE